MNLRRGDCPGHVDEPNPKSYLSLIKIGELLSDVIGGRHDCGRMVRIAKWLALKMKEGGDEAKDVGSL